MDNPRKDPPFPLEGTAEAVEMNVALVRRIYEEGLNGGDLTVLDQLVDEHFVDHSLFPSSGSGRDAFKQRFTTVRTAFPDANMTLEDGIGAGDKVVIRWTLRGTHTGPFASIAPTSRHIVVTGINITRIEGGKVVEHWASFDHMGLLQQLGVMTPYQRKQG
jgi:steroid delta-isomerase-like uncharacterized protein